MLLCYIAASLVFWLTLAVDAWQVPTHDNIVRHSRIKLDDKAVNVQRRDILLGLCGSIGMLLPYSLAHASDDDSRSQVAHSFRPIELLWDDYRIGRFPSAIDGINSENTLPGTEVELSYAVPANWDECYVDRYSKQRACQRIFVYQKTGTATTDALEKAASGQWKISRALDIGDRLDPDLCRDMKRATLRSHRVTYKGRNSEPYYEFDLEASGPDDDSGNLQFLVSATILNKRLFVCIVQANDEQVKNASNQLQLVRSSFQVKPTGA